MQRIRSEQFALVDSGYAVLSWPKYMSVDDFEEFCGWLELVKQRTERFVGHQCPRSYCPWTYDDLASWILTPPNSPEVENE